MGINREAGPASPNDHARSPDSAGKGLSSSLSPLALHVAQCDCTASGRVPSEVNGMKVEEIKPRVFTLTMTAHELSVLLAGARMSLDIMDADPGSATAEARSALSSVLKDFDRALKGGAGTERAGD